MNINVAETYGTDLASRYSGERLRKQVLGNPERSVLDFSGVKCISHGFADEFFAVLVAEQGEDWFREYIEVIGLSPEIRYEVLSAIELRLKDMKS